MNLSKEEYQSFIHNKTCYLIEYETPYSKGSMIIDTKFYDKVIKKINKAFKDVRITKFEEVNKSDYN